jgi:hypothetical protein
MASKGQRDGTIDGAANEIRRLHADVILAAKTALAKAIKIGELLYRIRASRQGEWLLWLQANMPFTHRTALNYMECYNRRDELEAAHITNLKDAYALLLPPVSPSKSTKKVETSFNRADDESGNVFDRSLGQTGPVNNTETAMQPRQKTKSVRTIMREISPEGIDRGVKNDQVKIDRLLAETALRITRHNRALWPEFPERLITHGNALIRQGERLRVTRVSD